MTFPIIHRAITSLCRALGIVSSVDDVVIMPLGKWHEWHEEKERLRRRVEEFEGNWRRLNRGEHMGMFDYVKWDERLKMPIPLNYWQTKDFICYAHRVFISPDGVKIDDEPFIGTREVDCCTMFGGGLIEYRAVVWDGHLVRITKIDGDSDGVPVGTVVWRRTEPVMP